MGSNSLLLIVFCLSSEKRKKVLLVCSIIIHITKSLALLTEQQDFQDRLLLDKSRRRIFKRIEMIVGSNHQHDVQ